MSGIQPPPPLIRAGSSLFLRSRRRMALLVGLVSLIVAPLMTAAQTNVPELPPLIPVVTTADDLPERLVVDGSDLDLDDHPNHQKTAFTVPARSTVYVMDNGGESVLVFAPSGGVGWAWRYRLDSAPAPATAADAARIRAAIAKPQLQQDLPSTLRQWLQAAYARSIRGRLRYFHPNHTDWGREHRAALSLIRERGLENVLPAILQLWEFASEFGYNADYETMQAYVNRRGHHPLFRDFFPKVGEALGSLATLDQYYCRTLTDEQRGERQGQHRFGADRDGELGTSPTLAALAAIHQEAPPSDCLLRAAEAIARDNPIFGGGEHQVADDVATAFRFLANHRSAANLVSWLGAQAKSADGLDDARLALALIYLRAVSPTPYLARLRTVASAKSSASDGQHGTRRLALWALHLRAPSAQVDDITRQVLLEPHDQAPPRFDAALILADRPPSAATAKAFESLLLRAGADDGRENPDHEFPGLRRIAAETLAGDGYRQRALSLFHRLIGDRDPYIARLAFDAVRAAALASLRKAASAEERDKIRGDYLNTVRQQVETASLLPAAWAVKPVPQWMFKPQATQLRIGFKRPDEPEGAFVVRLQTPQLQEILDDYSYEAVALDVRPRPRSGPASFPLSAPWLPRVLARTFDIHPGQYWIKYGSGRSRATRDLSIRLDGPGLNHAPLVAPDVAGLYSVSLLRPGNLERPYDEELEPILRVVWYCEPDPAFWSDAEFESAGEGRAGD